MKVEMMLKHTTNEVNYGFEALLSSVAILIIQKLMRLPSLENGFILEILLTVTQQARNGTSWTEKRSATTASTSLFC